MEQPSQEAVPIRSRVSRFETLDYVRGFASLIVLICHILYLGHAMEGPLWEIARWLPINILWVGGEAVILFFVLSGFALFLLYDSFAGRQFTAPIFILSRWIRLYPVYLLSTVFAIVAYEALGGMILQGAADLQLPPQKVTAPEVLQHLFVVGNPYTLAYNPPMWSIVYEIRFSILFPLIFPLVKRWGVWVGIASSVLSLSIAGVFFSGLARPEYYTMAGQILGTLYYGVYFIFGALLAYHREKLSYVFRRLTISQTIAMLCLCLLIFCYAFPFAELLVNEPETRGDEMFVEFVVGLSACGIIALAVTRPLKSAYPLFSWLGSISFSLYLTHYTVISIINILFESQLSQAVLFPIHFVCSIAVAHLVWKTLEVPSLLWSRYVRLWGERGAVASSA